MSELAYSLPASRKVYRIAVSVLFFLQGICFSTWTSRIPSIQQALRLSDAGLGLVLFALPVGSLLSLPFSGYLVSRFGSRRMVLFSLMYYAVVLTGLGLARTEWQLIGVLLLYGIAGNLSNIAINTQAIGVEALYGRSVMASFHGLWSLAGFVAGSIGQFMIGNGIIPYHHFALITLTMLLTVAITNKFTLREDYRNEGESTKQGFLVKPDRYLLNLGIISFCAMMCEGAMFDWSGVYFRDVVKAEAGWVGAGFTVFMSTMAAGRFFADRFHTRYGMKRTLQLSGLLTASGLLLAILFPDLVPAMTGFFLVGFGVSSVVPLIYSAAGRSKVMPAGMALAAVSSIGFIGFLIGPPLIGIIAGASSLRVSFALIACMGVMVSGLTTWLNLED